MPIKRASWRNGASSTSDALASSIQGRKIGTAMTWFKRQPQELDTSGEKKVKTEGLWVKCEQCRQIIWKKDLEENWNVCPKCDKHFRVDAMTRIAQMLDGGEFEMEDDNL